MEYVNFWQSIEFQFTPLREGRRGFCMAYKQSITISIHAPAGGATIRHFYQPDGILISIHAPAGGATEREHR